MAGSKEEKTLLAHTSRLLSKIGKPWALRGGNRTQGVGGICSQPSSAESESYNTWPPQNLRATIHDVATKINKSLKKDLEPELFGEVESAVNEQCPFHIEEQIDFCLICPQVDHMEALRLQQQLSAEYEVTGTVLWDCALVGSDIFSVLETMLQRSTLFLFYITEKYDDSDACAHVAKNLLITPQFQEFQGRVIPLIKDFDTPIPETFQLIDKLCLSSKLQFRFRFPAVFSPEIKHEKVLRTQKLKKKLDEQRTTLVNRVVCKKLELCSY